jgi:4-cresol dehydrogenase (hydroxylating)
LPTGECIHTGYGAFENTHTGHLDAWGIGPSLTGLFSQSNFGIVTRATIWLMRAPERSSVAFFTLDNDNSDHILKSGPFFGNVYQALQKVMTYPWTATGGMVPLPLPIALKLAAPHRYSLWNGSVGLYGTSEEVVLQQERLTRALAGKASWLEFVDGTLIELDQKFPPSRQQEVRSVVAGFTGGIGGTGGCGFKFWSANSPFRGRDAIAVASQATEIVLRHGFEPSIGIFPVRERALQFYIACAYDRRAIGHDAAVMACHMELSSTLMDCGYYPTRLGVGSMGAIDRYEPAYLRIMQALKTSFDPNGVLAPARYMVPHTR